MKINNLILVGGVGRSGTSILGAILGSAKNTEFFYEPATFMFLLETAENWKDQYQLRHLLRTLINKDLLKGALSGRGLNHNRNDLSSVYRYKTDEEIEERMKSSFRQDQLNDAIVKTNAVIKVLDNIANVDSLSSHIDNFKRVVVFRKPVDTVNSILNKSWFSNQSLSIESPEPASFTHEYHGFRIRTFINKEDQDRWITLSEVDRALFYYNSHFQKFLNMHNNGDVFFIPFEKLVHSPFSCVEKLFLDLGLNFGNKTQGLVNEVRLPDSSLINKDYLQKPSEAYKELASNLYDELLNVSGFD